MKPTPEDGFYFASVGGNPAEIVRIHSGLMYSTGCADGHPLHGIELIRRIDQVEFPKTQAEKSAQQKTDERVWEARKKERVRQGLPAYGYRRFDEPSPETKL